MRRSCLSANVPAFWVLLGCLCGPVSAAFPEYLNQDSATTHWHSGICTSDGQVVWDYQFDALVSDPSGTPLTYYELAFAFMQCYGGGMIDELTSRLGAASFTAAARHNERSWNGVRDPATSGQRESYYNVHYSPYAGGSTVRPHGAAALHAYNNDLVGPVIQNTQNNPPEHPQYRYNYVLTDRTDVTLHRPNFTTPTPPSYLAILFGGSSTRGTDFSGAVANYNSLVRIHDDLMARGYTASEIYLMYPGTTDPWGGSLPSTWTVDDGTSFQDMQDAWTWANSNSTAGTQVYFWSTVSHGTRGANVKAAIQEAYGEEIQSDRTYGFELDVEFVEQTTELFHLLGGGEGRRPGQPHFQVIAPQPLPDLGVTLNGEQLVLLETSDVGVQGDAAICHRFALDELDVGLLSPASNTLALSWSGGPIEFKMVGPTTGIMSNEIPEPATLMLLAFGGLAAMRRRRR